MLILKNERFQQLRREHKQIRLLNKRQEANQSLDLKSDRIVLYVYEPKTESSSPHLKVVCNLKVVQKKIVHRLVTHQLVVMMVPVQKRQTQVLVQAIKQVRG